MTQNFWPRHVAATAIFAMVSLTFSKKGAKNPYVQVVVILFDREILGSATHCFPLFRPSSRKTDVFDALSFPMFRVVLGSPLGPVP